MNNTTTEYLMSKCVQQKAKSDRLNAEIDLLTVRRAQLAEDLAAMDARIKNHERWATRARGKAQAFAAAVEAIEAS